MLLGCQTKQLQNCLEIAQATPQTNLLQLNNYRLDISKKVVEGITNNLSALTWNGDTQSLFGVVNNPASIVELSTQGKLLRQIPIQGIKDPEAIEYLGDNRFIVSDEHDHRLLKLTVDRNTKVINTQDTQRLTLKGSYRPNKGLEGLAYNPHTKTLFVSNESNPIILYKITGFIEGDAVSVTEIKKNWADLLTDISGLHYYSPEQVLLVLSDESKLLWAINDKEQIIGCLPLTIGQQGLLHSIRQPEGITMDNEGNLYIVSEPNFFYKYSLFKK